MSNLSDDIFKDTIIGMILGAPIIIGISILVIPFAIISLITGIPTINLLLYLSVFIVGLLVVGLLSRFQIIENGIVGMIAGLLVYTFLKWHALACISIGVVVVGALFFVTNIKIGFWIKTILFSVIETFIVFMCIYSESGLFPTSDMVWKVFFVIVFFLENILIRCTVANKSRLLFSGYVESKKKKYDQNQENEEDTESSDGSFEHNEERSNVFWFRGINNAEELKKRYRELMKIYHPDNQAGDTSMVQQIQAEYEELLKKVLN